MFTFRRPFPVDEDKTALYSEPDAVNWNNQATDHRQKRARLSKHQSNAEENAKQRRDEEAIDKYREEIEKGAETLETIKQEVETWRTMAEEQEVILERARNRIRNVGPLFEKTVESGRNRLSRRSQRLSYILENLISEIGNDQKEQEDQDNQATSRTLTVSENQSTPAEGRIVKSRKHGRTPFFDASIPSLNALLLEAMKRLETVKKLTDEIICGNWSTGKGELLLQSGMPSNNSHQLLMQASYSAPTNDRDFIAAIKRLAACNSSATLATGLNSYSTESQGNAFPGQMRTEDIMNPNLSWLTEVFNALKIGCNDIGHMRTKGDGAGDGKEGKEDRERIMRALQRAHLRGSTLVRRVEHLKRRLEEVDPMSGGSSSSQGPLM